MLFIHTGVWVQSIGATAYSQLGHLPIHKSCRVHIVYLSWVLGGKQQLAQILGLNLLNRRLKGATIMIKEGIMRHYITDSVYQKMRRIIRSVFLPSWIMFVIPSRCYCINFQINCRLAWTLYRYLPNKHKLYRYSPLFIPYSLNELSKKNSAIRCLG